MGKQWSRGLVAVGLTKGVKGGSGAVMVQASDGRYYVVKSPKGPQHRRTIVNDYLAGGLAHLLGLPTPAPHIVFVPPGLVQAQNGSERRVWQTGQNVVFHGLCFASLVPVDPTVRAVYDCLPLSLWDDVANPEVALGCWLFDCWTSNADCVQIVVHRARKKRGLQGHYWLTKIDHGHCFEAQNWTLKEKVKHLAYWQMKEASRVCSLEDFEPCFTAIRSLTVGAIQEIVKQIPGEWLAAGESEALGDLANRLVFRAGEIPKLMNVWWPADQVAMATGLGREMPRPQRRRGPFSATW